MDGKLNSVWDEIKLQNLHYIAWNETRRSSRKCSKTIQFALKCINVEIYFQHALKNPFRICLLPDRLAPHDVHTKQRTKNIIELRGTLGKSEHDT